MDILSYMKNHVLLLDGGMGTMLARQGLMGSALPEQLHLSYPHHLSFR